ncbi:uracil-DNA glycosylase [Mycoplasma phocoeninasale]|uniref:Uracil-DNA glycosylase n=1 Tax=Mycoplasma phocoeninasale TaxID=2726117 RepID=A0A858U4S6_9MOLU|nr:uracil-DNA glycosylase [Mycoplasma phocoeninasale]QJG66417.1 uracil-DNA glycosylase [Mycoplasma phocoeninasale]
MKFNFIDFFNRQKPQEYFKKLTENLKGRNITPPKRRIFFALENFDFDNLKVIIIGQDPYPGENVADGLCFSSNEKKTPASLLNIFKEIKSSYPECSFSTNNLDNWKKQGVLLLNSILTNEVGRTLAHKNIGWETFTLNLLSKINAHYNNVIYLILGNYAKNFIKSLDLTNQIVLSTSHPSPLGVNAGFKGSKIFEKVNDKLKELNKSPIDWSTR